MNLWAYWEGDMPRHIQLCLASLQQACRETEFCLVTPGNLHEYLGPGDLHANFRDLREPAHRADCVRAALLARHGGFYFDADTIGLADPAPLASDHQLVYCTWTKSPRRVLNGYVYARPGSLLAEMWRADVNDRLARGVRGLPWTALGEMILTPWVDRFIQGDPSCVREIPRETFLPVDVDMEPHVFFEDRDPSEFETPDTVCWGMNQSWMMHHKRADMTMSEPEMANSRKLIHRLFTRTKRILDRDFA